MSMYGLSHVQHFWESKRDTRVLLAWGPTAVVLERLATGLQVTLASLFEVTRPDASPRARGCGR